MKLNAVSVRNQIRVGAVVASMVLMAGAQSAWAAVDVTGDNGTTGSNSDNRNTYDVIDSNTATANNDSTVTNRPDVTANTGSNDVEDNTTVEDVTGGDIDVQGEFDNELNSGDFAMDLSQMGDVSADFSNDTTGSNSKNHNTLDVTRTNSMDVNNDARVTNDINANLDSGNNNVRDNTTVGDVDSGNIDFSVDVTNTTNQSGSGTMMPDFGSNDVDANFSNDTTGSSSDNFNTATVSDTNTVDLINNSNVNNTLDVNGDSGSNNTKRNTTVGDVSTGDQSYDFSFTNVLN